MTEKRVVALNCIDGRAQLPVIHFIQNHYKADYVDMITEPGIDGVLAQNDMIPDDIKQKINISLEKNHSEIIFIVGHHDCKANPVDESLHKEHILCGVDKLKNIYADVEVVGLWIDAQWSAHIL